MTNATQRKLALEYVRNPDIPISKDILDALSVDSKFLIEVTRKYAPNIQLASQQLLNDKMFAMEVLTKASGAYRFMPESIRSDKECTLRALDLSPANLAYAVEELRADKDVVMKAIRSETCFNSEMHSSPSFNLASKDLKEDSDVLEEMKDHIKFKIKQAEMHERNGFVAQIKFELSFSLTPYLSKNTLC